MSRARPQLPATLETERLVLRAPDAAFAPALRAGILATFELEQTFPDPLPHPDGSSRDLYVRTPEHGEAP